MSLEARLKMRNKYSIDGINETLNIQTSMFNHKLEAVPKTVLKTVLLKTNFLAKNAVIFLIANLSREHLIIK